MAFIPTKTIEQTVRAFEKQTSAELVVAIAPRSAVYADAVWTVSALLTLVVFTVYMYAEFEFYDNHIYLGSVLTFVGAFLLMRYVPFLQRPFTRRNTRRYHTELGAHATFSRQQLHATMHEVGTLIYISVLEREVVIIADRGVQNAVGMDVLQQWERDLSQLFQQADPATAFAQCVERYAAQFAQAMPIQANDVDELASTVAFNKRGRPHKVAVGMGGKSIVINPENTNS